MNPNKGEIQPQSQNKKSIHSNHYDQTTVNEFVSKYSNGRKSPKKFVIKTKNKQKLQNSQTQQKNIQNEPASNKSSNNKDLEVKNQKPVTESVKPQIQGINHITQKSNSQIKNDNISQNKNRRLIQQLPQKDKITNKTTFNVEQNEFYLNKAVNGYNQTSKQNQIFPNEQKQINSLDKAKSSLNSQQPQQKTTAKDDSNNKIYPNQNKQISIQQIDKHISTDKFDQIAEVSNKQQLLNQLQKNEISYQAKGSNNYIDYKNCEKDSSSYGQNATIFEIKKQSNIKQNQNQQKNEGLQQFDINRNEIQFDLPNLEKIKTGLPNIGLTCYVNSAVQTLRQIYYFDQTIFNSSGYAQDFKKLFKEMEDRNTFNIESCMQRIFFISKENQTHDFGGDAFLSLSNFLSLIKDSLPKYQKKQFDSICSRVYKDQLYCFKCDEKIPDTDEIFSSYIYEEFGYECNQLNQAFQDEGDKDLLLSVNNQAICEKCKGKKFYATREYTQSPYFMFIRLNSFLSSEESKKALNQEFYLADHQKNISYYKIIGFCNHYGYHYTYTAKYDKIWIEFNDSYCREIEPDCSKAIYFLFKKL